MLEGLYTAAAGMVAQQQRMDSLAGDLANVNTTAYKHARTGFRDLVYAAAGRGGAADVPAGAGAAVQDAGRSFRQGPLQPTGQPLDFALEGPGFIQVRTPEGVDALTRDGSLRVTNGGQLVTAAGAQVIPPITIPNGVDLNSLAIAPDGTITVGGTQVLGQLVAVNVIAPQSLTPAGSNLFVANAESGAPQPVATTFAGGHLEGSNVELSDVMVDMMNSQRAYQLAARAIHQQDEMMGIANGVKR